MTTNLVYIPHTEDCTCYDLLTGEEIVPIRRLGEHGQ